MLQAICELNVLMKISLNNDDHQIHQYQQNKQSPLILTELTEHTHNPPTTYGDVEIPSPSLGQTQKCGGVIPVNVLFVM